MTLADSDQDDFWYPPRFTPIFYADADLIPCEWKKAVWWTYEGADQWYKAKYYPGPKPEDEP